MKRVVSHFPNRKSLSIHFSDLNFFFASKLIRFAWGSAQFYDNLRCILVNPFIACWTRKVFSARHTRIEWPREIQFLTCGLFDDWTKVSIDFHVSSRENIFLRNLKREKNDETRIYLISVCKNGWAVWCASGMWSRRLGYHNFRGRKIQIFFFLDFAERFKTFEIIIQFNFSGFQRIQNKFYFIDGHENTILLFGLS